MGGSTKQYVAGGFQVAATTTVKALATAGFATSAVATSTITIQGTTLINFANGFTATNMQFNAHQAQWHSPAIDRQRRTERRGQRLLEDRRQHNVVHQRLQLPVDQPQCRRLHVRPPKAGSHCHRFNWRGPGLRRTQQERAVKFDLFNNDGEGNNSTGLYVNGSTPIAGFTGSTGGLTATQEILTWTYAH